MMQSDKLVKSFEELTQPYKITPTSIIGGGVNGRSFCFYPGIPQEISYPEYVAILNSSLKDELWT